MPLCQIKPLRSQYQPKVLSFLERFRLHAVLLAAALALPAAQADVWGYVDARGVAHFASEKLDDRYELFFRSGSGGGFDTRQGVSSAPVVTDLPPAPPPTPRPTGLPTAPPKLLAFFEVSPRFKAVQHHLREAAQRFNLDMELLQAVIATESGFDPRAVSPKGAMGLMQVIAPTAARFGVVATRTASVQAQLFDPRTNVMTGSRYLRDLLNLFDGNLELALAGYNAGEGAVQRAGNRIPNFPETQNYVRTVMQLYTALKPPQPVLEARREAAANQPVQRLRMEIMPTPAAVPGLPGVAVPGAMAGRANMPPSLQAVPVAAAQGAPVAPVVAADQVPNAPAHGGPASAANSEVSPAR
jgi:hypothetical protein